MRRVQLGEIHPDVGKRLRSRREELGLSQRQLAFPGVSPAYISRIESGDRRPSLQVVLELARALSCDPHWLATGREGPVRAAAEELVRVFDAAPQQPCSDALAAAIAELDKALHAPETIQGLA